LKTIKDFLSYKVSLEHPMNDWEYYEDCEGVGYCEVYFTRMQEEVIGKVYNRSWTKLAIF
jgi:hypothetical protein